MLCSGILKPYFKTQGSSDKKIQKGRIIMITKIRKRDGRLVDYDISKIENAIAKAMMSLGDGEIKDCKKMARITELYLMEKFESKIPNCCQ